MSLSVLGVLLLGACAAGSATTIDGRPVLTREEAAVMPGVMGGNDDYNLGAPPPASPDEISIRPGKPVAETAVAGIRQKALVEGAQSYGAQMGYARRSWEIMQRLKHRSGVLSQVFDFNTVVERAPVGAGVVIPPVISTATRAFTVDAYGQEAAVADAYMLITRVGRIAPVAPTWRDYLIIDAPVPSEPPRSLLPANSAELPIFEAQKRVGWDAGVKQADDEFAERIARLQRDFHGMLQYRQLVANGMMNRMVLANADFGVTANEHEMRVGSRAVKITSEAEFNATPTQWSVKTLAENNALVRPAPGTLGDVLK